MVTGPGKEVTIYYIAAIELDKKWWENNKDHADLKAMLEEKLKTRGIGFRGVVRKSVLLADISKVQGIGRKTKGER
jgi:hypothetical protein